MMIWVATIVAWGWGLRWGRTISLRIFCAVARSPMKASPPSFALVAVARRSCMRRQGGRPRDHLPSMTKHDLIVFSETASAESFIAEMTSSQKVCSKSAAADQHWWPFSVTRTTVTSRHPKGSLAAGCKVMNSADGKVISASGGMGMCSGRIDYCRGSSICCLRSSCCFHHSLYCSHFQH